jgi:shikimate kinase
MEPAEKPKAEKKRRPRRRPRNPLPANRAEARSQAAAQPARPSVKKHPRQVKKFTGNIVLCGFMGCGKSSVGRRAAKLLGRQFCDLDRYIEQKAGMTVTEIFQKEGEEGFRARETQAAEEAASQQGMVIACGGGTVLSQRNVDAFHKHGAKILFLDVPVAALQERLKNDKRRPLLQVPDRRKVIAELYEKRCPLYQAAADMTIDGGAPAVVVAKRVAKHFQ